MSSAQIKVVYSDAYEVDIGAHVFPTVKFRLVRERLIRDKIIKDKDFVQAPEASSKQILLVHTKPYLDKLTNATLSSQEIFTLEVPYSPELVYASRVCVGGTIMAARLVFEGAKIAVHLGGGFHHAFADHGEGFCLLNDVACAVRFCLQSKKAKKIIIVDCDLHQGNGNAHIFRECKDVFTFSIHQENNYPLIKPPSDLDIGLDDGEGDDEYLKALNENLSPLFQRFKPEILFYIAGADPYCKDRLGGLNLSLEGLRKRDTFVFNLAKQNKIPTVVVFGGGYAQDIDDTVAIHYNTVKTACDLLSKGGY